MFHTSAAGRAYIEHEPHLFPCSLTFGRTLMTHMRFLTLMTPTQHRSIPASDVCSPRPTPPVHAAPQHPLMPRGAPACPDRDRARRPTARRSCRRGCSCESSNAQRPTLTKDESHTTRVVTPREASTVVCVMRRATSTPPPTHTRTHTQ